MVRLAVVHRVSFLPLNRGGAKQLYGVRPARLLPSERTAAMSQTAPQKPLRAVRRLVKATGSILAVTAADRDPSGNRDPVKRSVFRSASRIVPVSAWLGVRAASCGRWFNGFALLDTLLIRDAMGSTGSAARGPIQSQRGRASRRIGPKGLIGIGVPLLRGLFERSPWRAPVRHIAPRAGPVFASVNQHGFIQAPQRLRVVRCLNTFRYFAP